MGEDLESYKLVNTDEAHDFVKRCMLAAGVEETHAVDLANLLLAADTRGHFSHGINRLGMNLELWAATGNRTLIPKFTNYCEDKGIFSILIQ